MSRGGLCEPPVEGERTSGNVTQLGEEVPGLVVAWVADRSDVLDFDRKQNVRGLGGAVIVAGIVIVSAMTGAAFRRRG
jgi:hypothetical protein